MALSIHDLRAKISRLPASVAKDVQDVIDHPQFLTGLLAGPEGPLLIAEAHRSGALGKALGAVGLGGPQSHMPLMRPEQAGHSPGHGTPGRDRAPRPSDMPILTRDGKVVCADVEGGQPFTLQGFKSLAAGAQTQGTDIVDFHAAASNPTIITSDDLVLGNVEVFDADLFISARAVTTAGFEGTAFLASAYLIEYVNSIEKARWALRSLGGCLGFTGMLTSGGVSANYDIDGRPSVAWHRKYDPNIKAKTALQIPVTTTTIEAIDCTLIEEGVRP